MTATITADDANSFIKKLGFESLSSIESAAFIEQVNSKDAELDAAGYSDAKVQLIKLYLVGMMSINGVRQLASKGLDVISKSYKYGTLQETYDWLLSRVTEADTASVMTSLIPSSSGGAFMFVGTGGFNE